MAVVSTPTNKNGSISSLHNEASWKFLLREISLNRESFWFSILLAWTSFCEGLNCILFQYLNLPSWSLEFLQRFVLICWNLESTQELRLKHLEEKINELPLPLLKLTLDFLYGQKLDSCDFPTTGTSFSENSIYKFIYI